MNETYFKICLFLVPFKIFRQINHNFQDKCKIITVTTHYATLLVRLN